MRQAIPEVSVLVVTHESGSVIAACLDALRAQTFRNFELIVIDNGSSDVDIVDGEIRRFGNCTFRPLNRNLGFAAANNRAAEIAQGRWIALLNPDAFANPDWLQRLLEGAQSHAPARSFASLQVCAGDGRLLDGAGDVMTFWGFPYRGGYRKKIFAPAEGEVFSACGAAMFVDRRLFLDVGGFDESFFCYCEDVDLGYRLRLLGEPTVLLPRAVVRHVGGASSKGNSSFAVFHGSRNRIWTYVKNTPPVLFWCSLPFHAGMTVVMALIGLRRGIARQVCAGVLAALAELPRIWTARKALRTISTATSANILALMALNPMAIINRRTIIRKRTR